MKIMQSQDVTVQLTGVSAIAEIGRIAAKSVSRTGAKTRGRYDHEELRGQEFNVKGQLVEKVQIIDRKNDRYKKWGTTETLARLFAMLTNHCQLTKAMALQNLRSK